MAIGNRIGVASRAQLIAISERPEGGTFAGDMQIFRTIINDVRNKNIQGKAVICGTSGQSLISSTSNELTIKVAYSCKLSDSNTGEQIRRPCCMEPCPA